MTTAQPDSTSEFFTDDTMSYNHATIAYRLTKQLSRYDTQFDILPELEFDLPYGRPKPDLAVCTPGKIDWFKDTIRPTTPPLIAIEILSPRQALSDLTDKTVDIYFPSGVATVWVIIPQLRQLTVLTLTQQQPFITGIVQDQHTGIKLDLDALFAY